jgi:copper oxidase (laccase) domain-containing protein
VSAGDRLSDAGHPLVHTRFTDRHDGDLCVDLPADELALRRRAVAPPPWTWLRQVHGATVVTVTRPGEHASVEADAAVTDVVGATLAVHTADCAGVLLQGTTAQGRVVVGAAHAGWRGLHEGVLDATVQAMRDLGVDAPSWQLGPCICPLHYEFGMAELDLVAGRLGEGVRARTAEGATALDLRAGVAAALAAAGARPLLADPLAVRCTAEDPDCYSWRARRDAGRQAAVIWIGAA